MTVKYSDMPPPIVSQKTHYLHPAALFVSTQPHIVTTVLGTCVSVCLWDRVQLFGGINHYMLPYWNGDGLASPKYGNISMDRLYNKMVTLGAKPNHMIAKVFGGKAHDDQHSVFNIGEKNAMLAFDFLEKTKITVLGHSVGGPNGRKIQYNTYTGEVRMKTVRAIGSR